MDNQIIYKTETPFLKYALPIICMIASLVLYFLKAHIFVVGTLALFSTLASFKYDLIIFVYKDKFNIAYKNCYGDFMSIENIFYYNDISSFEFTILKSDLDAKKIALLVALEATLPGRLTRLHKNPITYVTIKTKNPLGEVDTIEIQLDFSGESYTKALDLIKKKCKSADK